MSIDLIKPPTRFVGLHAHSHFSTFDGLGYPADHIDFITSESQGMDAWALTDHGNGNGLAHAHSHAAKLQKQGKNYRSSMVLSFISFLHCSNGLKIMLHISKLLKMQSPLLLLKRRQKKRLILMPMTRQVVTLLRTRMKPKALTS